MHIFSDFMIVKTGGAYLVNILYAVPLPYECIMSYLPSPLPLPLPPESQLFFGDCSNLLKLPTCRMPAEFVLIFTVLWEFSTFFRWTDALLHASREYLEVRTVIKFAYLLRSIIFFWHYIITLCFFFHFKVYGVDIQFLCTHGSSRLNLKNVLASVNTLISLTFIIIKIK